MAKVAVHKCFVTQRAEFYGCMNIIIMEWTQKTERDRERDDCNSQTHFLVKSAKWSFFKIIIMHAEYLPVLIRRVVNHSDNFRCRSKEADDEEAMRMSTPITWRIRFNRQLSSRCDKKMMSLISWYMYVKARLVEKNGWLSGLQYHQNHDTFFKTIGFSAKKMYATRFYRNRHFSKRQSIDDGLRQQSIPKCFVIVDQHKRQLDHCQSNMWSTCGDCNYESKML